MPNPFNFADAFFRGIQLRQQVEQSRRQAALREHEINADLARLNERVRANKALEQLRRLEAENQQERFEAEQDLLNEPVAPNPLFEGTPTTEQQIGRALANPGEIFQKPFLTERPVLRRRDVGAASDLTKVREQLAQLNRQEDPNFNPLGDIPDLLGFGDEPIDVGGVSPTTAATVLGGISPEAQRQSLARIDRSRSRGAGGEQVPTEVLRQSLSVQESFLDEVGSMLPRDEDGDVQWKQVPTPMQNKYVKALLQRLQLKEELRARGAMQDRPTAEQMRSSAREATPSDVQQAQGEGIQLTGAQGEAFLQEMLGGASRSRIIDVESVEAAKQLPEGQPSRLPDGTVVVWSQAQAEGLPVGTDVHIIGRGSGTIQPR